MPQYLSPGVYVEEVDSGSRPIEGVGTAVAAFVGIAASGPLHEPTLVSNWTQFTNIFGEFVEGSYLAHSVYGYFMNGGGNAYVVRIGSEGAHRVGRLLARVARAQRGLGVGARRRAFPALGAEADDVGVAATVHEVAVDAVGEVGALDEVAEGVGELGPVGDLSLIHI